MRTDIAGHVLDDPEHRHLGLVEQVDRAGRVDQRQILRRRDDQRPGRDRLLDQRQLDVAGARRHVDQQIFGVAPVGIDQPASAPVAIGPRQASACPAETSCPSDRKCSPCAATGISLSSFGRRLGVAAEQLGLRRAVDVGVDQPDLLARAGERDGEVGGQRRLADAALAAGDGDQLAARLATRSARCGRSRPRAPPARRRAGRARAHRGSARQAGRVDDQRGDRADQLARADAGCVGQRVEAARAGLAGRSMAGDIGSPRALATVFRRDATYSGSMSIFTGLGAAGSRPVQRHQGTVGPDRQRRRRRPPADGGRRGPWGEPPKRGRRSTVAVGQRHLVRGFYAPRPGPLRRRGGGGGFPGRPDRSMVMWALLAFVAAVAGVHDLSQHRAGGSAAWSPASAAIAARSGRASA